jgi:acetoin:2,6-dichlorophenolindophenol oxidoreductase subunit beta
MVHHGRSEFAIFAADQIFTQAAKWRYQFGGEVDVHLTIRVAMGRQWGNGPQHTASYLQFFSGVPGLRVFIPSGPNQAERLLDLAISQADPVIFLEPRWLYQTHQLTKSSVQSGNRDSRGFDSIGDGTKVGIVTYGEGVLDAVLAAKQMGQADVKIFDFWDVTPGSGDHLISESAKVDSLIFYDPYCTTGGPLMDLATRLNESHPSVPWTTLRPPNVPVPTSTSLTEAYYLDRNKLASLLAGILGVGNHSPVALTFDQLHLPPKAMIGANWENITF